MEQTVILNKSKLMQVIGFIVLDCVMYSIMYRFIHTLIYVNITECICESLLYWSIILFIILPQPQLTVISVSCIRYIKNIFQPVMTAVFSQQCYTL